MSYTATRCSNAKVCVNCQGMSFIRQCCPIYAVIVGNKLCILCTKVNIAISENACKKCMLVRYAFCSTRSKQMCSEYRINNVEECKSMEFNTP